LAVGVFAVVGAAACGSGSGGNTGLAASQILRFPIFADPKTWDPGEMTHEVDTEIMQNVYDNLWRFDDNIKLVPDIATDVPSTTNGGISADGLTYTVHLNHNVAFSNGDKVTSKDVLYSWNRAAALKGGYSTNLQAIVGFNDVAKAAGKTPKAANKTDVLAYRTNIETHLAANDPAFMMKGLTAPDPYTVQIVLTAACGWCLQAWTLEGTTGAIVDENVIKTDPVDWALKPGEQVGTGAYMMTAYTPKQSVTFKQVPNWWGSPKPTLSEIDIDIKDIATQSTTIAAWEQGSYDIVGYGGYGTLPAADVLRIHGTSSEAGQLLLVPKARTTWLSPNIGWTATGGPFLGESAAAKGLRLAMDLSIDKQGLLSTVCHNLLCSGMTGGVIAKGLIGYLGDNTDPLAKFDPVKAKSLVQQYDPTGSKLAGLKYSFNASDFNTAVASYLQSQWQTNLGINVLLDPNQDVNAFINDRVAGKYVLSRDGWQFDYNHPQDWYDNLWGVTGVAAGNNSSGYGDDGSSGDGANDPQPTYDSTLAKADVTTDTNAALPLYNQLAAQMQADVAYIPLYQTVVQFLIHSYVQGAGSNLGFDYYWNRISLQSH
jgi:ABC-type oligopeptide transport system substrate-binding subunit